jgi:hypothetical protein
LSGPHGVELRFLKIRRHPNLIRHEDRQSRTGLRELADRRAQADHTPCFGGADRGVGKIELRRIDLGLIERHRAFVLRNQKVLIVGLLLGNRVALDEELIPSKVFLRLFVQRLVTRQLRLGLIEHNAVIAIVDARNHVTGDDVLVIRHRHGGDVARDLRRNGR